MKEGINNVFNDIVTSNCHFELGNYNKIGKNFKIISSHNDNRIIIGDCNIINDNVKIIIQGKGDFYIGDWNVFHNDILIIVGEESKIGHNCWFGQHTVLDGSGGLIIGNGVRIGMFSQIWSHVASGEQIEGCTLFEFKKTVLEDDVWLVGNCFVNIGLKLGKKSICLNNSLITKDTLPNKVYAGNPAKLQEKMNFYKDISLDEKFNLIVNWSNEFVKNNKNCEIKIENEFIELKFSKDTLMIFKNYNLNNSNIDDISYFYLDNKKYKKTLSLLEREFYKFLYNNKARFIPL